jgi:hypothetical protein
LYHGTTSQLAQKLAALKGHSFLAAAGRRGALARNGQPIASPSSQTGREDHRRMAKSPRWFVNS